MPELMSATTRLEGDLAEERSRAIRLLLASPLLDVDAQPDAFRLVVAHAGWLVDWFETACGWTLTVDVAAGFARLAKRSASVDAGRPLVRTRGSGGPFDRRRYQLVCLICAELVRHPVTTIGLLAGAVTAHAGLDTARRAERSAFVDAVRALLAWGVVRTTAGDVDAFVDDAAGNAILTADTARLHRLLVTTTSPSRLPEGTDVPTAIAELTREPRYGLAAAADGPAEGTADRTADEAPEGTTEGTADEAQRHRHARHSLVRRLLDDPVVHLDDLPEAHRDYLASPSGRRWVRDRVAEAGMELEERAEGLLAVDPDGLATDRQFPAPHGNAHQLALLLIDRLVAVDADGSRRLDRLSRAQLLREVRGVLERFPSWARSHRDDDGPDRLADDAVGLLTAFGLAHVDPDGTVLARPAMARYRVGEPAVVAPQASLFEEA